jgi:hypothetical protein
MKTNKSIEIGALVVVNSLPDATLYRVVDRQGVFGVGLIDATIEHKVPNQSVQWSDICTLRRPTQKQRDNYPNVS